MGFSMHKRCLLALLIMSCGVGLASSLQEGSGEAGGTDPLLTITAPTFPINNWSNYLLGTNRMMSLSPYMAVCELYADALEQRFSGTNALLNSLTRPCTPLLLLLNVGAVQRPLGSVKAHIYLLLRDYSILELSLTNMNKYIQNTQYLT